MKRTGLTRRKFLFYLLGNSIKVPDILSAFPLNYAYDDDETISIQDNWFQQWLFSYVNLNLSVGANIIDLLTVPAMELVTIDTSCIIYTGTPPTAVILVLTAGGLDYPFHNESAPPTGKTLVAYPRIYVAPFAQVRLKIFGATAGNDIDIKLIGTRYKFRDD